MILGAAKSAFAVALVVLVVACGGDAPVESQASTTAATVIPTVTTLADQSTTVVEPEPSTAPTTSAATTSTTATSTTAALVLSENMRVDVVETVAHDVGAFTQGLVFAPDGRLFESTGLEGESTLRELDPETGAVLRVLALDDGVFAEGLALVDDRLVQITWQDGQAVVYDRDTFAPLQTFAYEGEGWGLCYDGTRLVMSDGTDTLDLRDAETFEVLGTVDVTRDGSPVELLNELECVGDKIYANVWRSDQIVVIDPSTGHVETSIDASALPRPDGADVLNGIAVDPDGGLWLTGKRWDTMYRVELEPV